MQSNKEIWKDIEGFEGIYEISNFGRLKSKRGICNYKPKPNGYVRVKLCKHGNESWQSIHRLVAESFIHKEKGKSIVMHIDNNPSNNHSSNLKWGTYSENNIQAISEKRRSNKSGIKRPYSSGEKSPTSIFTNVQVLAIKDAISKGHSLSKIGKYFRTSRGTIWKIKAGYSWRSVY